jgi:L-ascorbate metabolism protein UlaG (beta-lactamase superfamily)
MSNQARLIFHRRTFFELVTPKSTLFIDPVFSHERRGRRVADETRPCDYVLATSMTPWFDDVLDVLDGCAATVVATPRVARTVSDELELKSGRLLDMEAWERASDEGLRITALPITASIGMEAAINEGVGIMRDVGNVFPKRAGRSLPMVDNMFPMLNSGLRSAMNMVGNAGSMSRPRSVEKVTDMLGVDVGRLTGGRPGLGFLFEVDGCPSVMHLADGVHEGTDMDDLEDMADLCQPDVLVMHAAGMAVEPIVRAARALKPKTVLLYRSQDPYRRGRQGQAQPISSFIGAIEEGAPGCTTLHMRDGEAFLLDRTASPKVKPAGDKPTSPGLGAKKPLSSTAKA